MENLNYSEFLKDAKKLKQILILRIIFPFAIIFNFLMSLGLIPLLVPFSESYQGIVANATFLVIFVIFTYIFLAIIVVGWIALLIREFFIGMKLCAINLNFNKNNKTLALLIIVLVTTFVSLGLISLICEIILLRETDYFLRITKRKFLNKSN